MKDAFGIHRDEIRITKAFTGYGDRALKGLRGTQQGLKMVAAQKGMKLRPRSAATPIPAQRTPLRASVTRSR